PQSTDVRTVTWNPKSILTAPWNGSNALIHSGSRAGSGANSADAALQRPSLRGWAACTANAWRSSYLPAATSTVTGAARSLTERFSPAATDRPGRPTSATATPPATTAAWAGVLIWAEPQPFLWLRNSPMTRASSDSFTFFVSGLAALISNS